MTSVEEMIEDCNSAKTCSNHPFSAWELDFINSITEQFEEKGGLSTLQQEHLEAIWEKI
jgi:hypothetical protein